MKRNQKDCLLTNLQIVVFGLLSLLLVVLTVLELLPDPGTGIEVRQLITVSSSSLSPVEAEEKDYHSQISGMLFNPNDDAITVDSMAVTVSDGKTEQTVTLAGFTLPARSTREIMTSLEGKVGFDRVTEVTLVRGDKTDVLPNQTVTSSGVSGIAVIYLLLLAATVFLTVRAAKVRYYLYQEGKMQ